jgi:hypothetical protein
MKKLELNQMENLEGGYDWNAFLGGAAFTGVCMYVGIVATVASPIAGIAAGGTCSLIVIALAARDK